jgi:hypothetical protein
MILKSRLKIANKCEVKIKIEEFYAQTIVDYSWNHGK